MKNKKILGALAALCMGIILCVSSVFAVNYWYTINNSANDNTVTTGHAITLSTTATNGTANYLYPGAVVQFEQFNVIAPEWSNDYIATYAPDAATGDAKNVLEPTFNLEVTALEITAGEVDFNTQFTVYIKTSVTNAWEKVDMNADTNADTLAKDMVLLEDIQEYADDDDTTGFTVQIRIFFNEDADAKYAEDSLKFTVGIVAYDGAGNKLADGVHAGTGGEMDPTDDNLFA